MRAFLVFGLLLSTAADAAETITYTYDARGRLKQVAHSGTVNNGITSCYSYDKADNRTNLTVGTGACPTPPGFAIGDASVTEGGTLVFTVTKTGLTPLVSQAIALPARVLPGGRALQKGAIALRGPTGLLRNSRGQFRPSRLKNPAVKEAGQVASQRYADALARTAVCPQ